MEELLKSLREFDALRDTLDHDRMDTINVRILPGREPIFASTDVFDNLVGTLQERLTELGIGKLYRHQAEAIKLIEDGEDVAIVSPPASGKTLCFNVPIVSEILRNPVSRALMVYPMKALANDQRLQFESLARGLAEPNIDSWLYDGDTRKDWRDLIRQHPPNVLITNPEMLHLSYLGSWESWQNYLANLRFLVIDEIHEYRGYFGTNVALLLRRLLRKLSELGSSPQMILASATCANPEEHARRLTGKAFKIVHAQDTGMTPTRCLIFINPNIPSYMFYRIYLLRIVRAALACLKNGLTTIVFCPTRRFAEEAARSARKQAEDFGLDASRVVPYRAGYLPKQRRKVEEGLRSGKYRVVFSTNALEIGIDIGCLDACILAGFPDSVMSAWQRIGRVGRTWTKRAFVLFYALDNPIDRFYAENVEAFIRKPLDEIMIGLDNEELVDRHLSCLRSESDRPLSEDDRSILGDFFYERAVEQQGQVKPVRRYRPHGQVTIRNIYGTKYKLVHHNESIGTISGQQLHREAYVGAIYNHFGESYLVRSHGADEVFLEDADPNLRTEAIAYSNAVVSGILRGKRFRDIVAWHYGTLKIFDNFAGYRLIDERSEEILKEELVQPPRALSRSVRACWLSLENDTLEGLGDLSERLRVVECFFRTGTPFLIPCDKHDIESLHTSQFPATAYIYETVPGGIGIAEKLFDVWPLVLRQGKAIAEDCPCRNGCPRCIHVIRWDKDAETLRKEMGFEIVDVLLSLVSDIKYEIFDPKLNGWRKK